MPLPAGRPKTEKKARSRPVLAVAASGAGLAAQWSLGPVASVCTSNMLRPGRSTPLTCGMRPNPARPVQPPPTTSRLQRLGALSPWQSSSPRCPAWTLWGSRRWRGTPARSSPACGRLWTSCWRRGEPASSAACKGQPGCSVSLAAPVAWTHVGFCCCTPHAPPPPAAPGGPPDPFPPTTPATFPAAPPTQPPASGTWPPGRAAAGTCPCCCTRPARGRRART